MEKNFLDGLAKESLKMPLYNDKVFAELLDKGMSTFGGVCFLAKECGENKDKEHLINIINTFKNYLEENKQMCKYCNADYYIETKTNIMPAYGTLEEVAKAVNGQIHKTRVNFARVSINYCPMCGRKLDEHIPRID